MNPKPQLSFKKNALAEPLLLVPLEPYQFPQLDTWMNSWINVKTRTARTVPMSPVRHVYEHVNSREYSYR